jgi:hypothetical protein
MAIARNRAVDLLRSRSHQARLRERQAGGERLEELAEPDATDAVALRREIVNALQGLPTAQRQAIELAYYGGLTQTEIAREMGEPLGTIKSRCGERFAWCECTSACHRGRRPRASRDRRSEAPATAARVSGLVCPKERTYGDGRYLLSRWKRAGLGVGHRPGVA